MSLPTLPTFAEAAASQFHYGSYYAVFMVAPDGSRVYLGKTARKSGTGLLGYLSAGFVQELIKAMPNADTLTFKKTAAALILSNGYRITFGGTIRQEATN